MRCSHRAISRTSLAALTALAILATGAASKAEDAPSPWPALGISGTVRGTASSHAFAFDRHAAAAAASAWLTVDPQRFWGVKAFADGRVQTERRPLGARTSWELREAYVERPLGDIDLKIGRQIIVWGRADKVNPTDIWSVRDLTLVTTDDEDQRLGAAAVQAAWRLGAIRLIGVWQPEWRAPVFPVPPLPAGLTAHIARPAHPDAQAGIKIDHSGTGIDWSLSYAHAIDKTPDLRLDTPVSVDILYQPIDMYGADAAVPFGPYGLRAEAAYTRRRRPGEVDITAKYDDLFLVAGIERTFDGELSLNVQYLFRRNYGFHDPASVADPSRRFLAGREEVLANQFARDMSGFSLSAVDRFLNETLQAEIDAVGWAGRAGGTLGPKVSYAVNDRWQLIVGAQLYFGPRMGFFGEFHDASTLFAEVRRGF